VLDEAELLTIAIHPDHRRTGLGRLHLEQFHATAARLGATRAVLEVAVDNAAARALYDNAGYAVAGTRRGYYRTPEGAQIDAVIMARPLLSG